MNKVFPEPRVIAALREATEVLEILRRGHGTDVSAACYPALNNCREALEIIDDLGPPGMVSRGSMKFFFPPIISQDKDKSGKVIPDRWICTGGLCGYGKGLAYGSSPDEALEAWKKLEGI